MKLYLVPTPIGNLKDITYRAIEILNEVDLILAEDTRKTNILLKHYDISTKTESYHKFNEHQRTELIIKRLQSGQEIAIVTDAGTPGISDPGFFLVREAVNNNIPVETLPGATAFVPALVNSGLPCDKFVFEGFLPPKKGRQKRLKELTEEKRTMIFYESPYRIAKTLLNFIEVFGDERKVSVSRELTKIYEENIRGTLKEVHDFFDKKKNKGEFVIILEGLTKK